MDVHILMAFGIGITVVTLVNYFHWVRCKRSRFLWLPSSGWPQSVINIAAIIISVAAVLSLVDIVPISFFLAAILSFNFAQQIYSISAREHHYRKSLEPASGPLGS